MPKLTEEQILQARKISLLDYLQIHEPSNVRKSGANEYSMVESTGPPVPEETM